MNIRPSSVWTHVAVLMFLSIMLPAVAQSQDSGSASNPLFLSDDVMRVRIEAPITTLMRKRPDEVYLDGMFYQELADGTEQSLDLKVRTRGRYRRQKSTCHLPPIRLNFKKGQVKGTEFAGQDKLKLVTHCKTKFERNEQLVLREYLVYRFLQLLTDKSFRVRLMHITYVDTEEKEDTVTRYGFVIEDKDDIADRLDLKLYESAKGLSYSDLDPKQTNLIAMFEFMIGNTDFSMIRGPANDTCCHNSIPYFDKENVHWPVPYDFDFSGMVNAPYAEPNPQFKIRNVRERVYRGRCSNNQYLEETTAKFREKEPEFRALVAGMSGLQPKYEKEVSRYLDQFYDVINDPKKLEKRVIEKCS